MLRRVSTSIEPLELDRSFCGDLPVAESREWLVTNGMGGFAAGTVAGSLTRRYHGLLFAAYAPPNGRRLLCPKIDAAVDYGGMRYDLATDRWQDGTVAPRGLVHIGGFRLEGSIAVWSFVCGDAVLERRIWMEHEANRTYVMYRVVRASGRVRLTLSAFANYRDLHAMTHAGNWTMDVIAGDGGVTVVPFAGATPIAFRADRGAVRPEHVWYQNFDHPEERARGLDDLEDHLLVATFVDELTEGDAMTVAVADHALAEIEAESALARRRAREDEAIAAWRARHPVRARDAPAWVKRLVLAADQFVVRCPLSHDPEARSIIAGYPWFGDWGRDTAISLPGLTLATGRPSIARSILLTFSRFIEGGMLPNYFPSDGRPAEYNTVDASLWFVRAVHRYFDDTGDVETLRTIYPAVRGIVEAYAKGTRFGIAVDPADGLLRAGEPGVQLTWMDAKVGDFVVTPRIGKPVEVNALWMAALRTCARFAEHAGDDARPFVAAAARAEVGFDRFWDGSRGWCYDVIDGPDGDDPSLRPNQLFAVALPIDVLDENRRRAIVDVCARRLATPAGLRSLAPGDPHYVGHYGGDPLARDGAYHQGTVWTWLAGPFVTALRRTHPARDGDALLAEVAAGVTADAFGTMAEIADGDPPFAARGAFAQAWSVAALLDAWATSPTESKNRTQL
jgi:predicted glycogen debranching enzyme